MRSGITRRWLRGSRLITVLLVLLVEVMFLYSATRSYYNGVQQTMYRRFSSITGQLKMYTGETSQKTAASRSVARAFRMAATASGPGRGGGCGRDRRRRVRGLRGTRNDGRSRPCSDPGRCATG